LTTLASAAASAGKRSPEVECSNKPAIKTLIIIKNFTTTSRNADLA
jgi:hypothetical protein